MNQDVFVLVTMLEEDCKKTEPGLISHLGRETGELCLETTVLCARLYCAKSLQSRPTLCYPRDRSPPGSSVHDILQANILEWVVMPSSRGSSQPRDKTCLSHVSCIGRQVLYHQLCLGSPTYIILIGKKSENTYRSKVRKERQKTMWKRNSPDCLSQGFCGRESLYIKEFLKRGKVKAESRGTRFLSPRYPPLPLPHDMSPEKAGLSLG